MAESKWVKHNLKTKCEGFYTVNMARIATVDAMVEAIRESDQPALSKQGIADYVGVSWQTINNHEDELEDDPRVESGQVGKSKIFWLEEDEEPDTDAIDGYDATSERQSGGEVGDEAPEAGTETETTVNADSSTGSVTERRRDWRDTPADVSEAATTGENTGATDQLDTPQSGGYEAVVNTRALLEALLVVLAGVMFAGASGAVLVAGATAMLTATPFIEALRTPAFFVGFQLLVLSVVVYVLVAANVVKWAWRRAGMDERQYIEIRRKEVAEA